MGVAGFQTLVEKARRPSKGFPTNTSQSQWSIPAHLSITSNMFGVQIERLLEVEQRLM